jgi:hypothetical protein
MRYVPSNRREQRNKAPFLPFLGSKQTQLVIPFEQKQKELDSAGVLLVRARLLACWLLIFFNTRPG